MELEGRQRPADAPRDRTQTIVRRSGSSDSGRPLTPAGVTPPQPGGEDQSFELLEGDPDRYTNKGEHARGGLGRVLRARDHRLGRTVAIKELLHQSDASEGRFVREALITARLQHPGVVPVHEAGRWPNGEPYYVMKLISGRSMKELIRDADGVTDRLALLPKVIAVAEAIAYAHSEGVIHRDIKPANVVVGEFGETVVVDWGIAKDRSGAVAPPEGEELGEGSGSGSGAAAQTAGVLGTPCYMPPEQAHGDDVDERADVYALGALLYEVLAGEQPYSDADSGDVLARVLAGPPVPLENLEAGVPPDLLAVVRKAMARDPRDRYRTAKEVAEDLKRFQTGQLVTAHHYSTMTLVKRWMWRNRALVGVALAAVVALGVLGTLAVTRVIGERNVARAKQTQAEQAERATEKRRRQLLLLQARSSLDRDPTAAVAWLKTYPEGGGGGLTLRAMVDEAESRGVARHVFRLSDWGYGADFSPDSRHLAVIANDKSLRIYDVATGAGKILGHHDAPPQAVQFSPDGTRIITGTEHGTVGFWDLASGEHTIVQGHRSVVWTAAFSPSGKRAVSAADRYHLRIWDAARAESVFEAKGPAAFSPRGDFAVSFHPETRAARVIDVETGAERALPMKGFEPKGEVYFPAISNGGDQVMIRDIEGGVWHYAAASGWRRLGAHEGKVDSVQFSPSGRQLATMGFDRTIRLFDTSPSKGAKSAPRMLRGHLDAIYMLAWTADERYAVSASDDGTARVWDLESGTPIRVLRGHGDDVYRVAISPDQKHIATVSLDGSARLWASEFADERRLRQGTEVVGLAWAGETALLTHDRKGWISAWDTRARTQTRITQLAKPKRMKNGGVVSRDGSHAAGLSTDGKTIRVWNTLTGEMTELAHDSFVKPAVWGFTPDNKQLLATDYEAGVIMWDVEAKEPRVLAAGDYRGPAALSADGREIALYQGDTLTLWDLAEEKVVFEKTAKQLGVSSLFRGHMVGYSLNGRWVAVFSMTGEIALIDRRDGHVKILSTGEDKLTSVEFSPDGRYIGASAPDRTVRLWDTESGEHRIFAGHTDLVYKVQFSPDSRSLASASYDKTARLWDISTGRSRVLRGHAGSVDTIAYSPSGETLATGSRDGTVRLWDVRGALDPVDGKAIRHRMKAITSAVIGPDDQPETVSR